MKMKRKTNKKVSDQETNEQLEQATRIELAWLPWQGSVLPLNYACKMDCEYHYNKLRITCKNRIAIRRKKMIENKQLADLIFPEITQTLEDLEKRYPPIKFKECV